MVWVGWDSEESVVRCTPSSSIGKSTVQGASHNQGRRRHLVAEAEHLAVHLQGEGRQEAGVAEGTCGGI